MRTILRLITALVRILSLVLLLILFPSIFLNLHLDSRVWTAAAMYAIFIFNSLYPAIKGQFSKRKDDVEPITNAEKYLDIVVLFLFWALHYIALIDYRFSFFGTLSVKSLSPFLSNGIVLLALVVMMSGLVLSFNAVRTLGVYFDRLTIKKNQPLLTDGVYGWVRHPIYLAYLLLFAGFTLLFESLLAFGCLIIAAWIWSKTFIKREEDMLHKKFGSEYDTYRQKTAMLLPYLY